MGWLATRQFADLLWRAALVALATCAPAAAQEPSRFETLQAKLPLIAKIKPENFTLRDVADRTGPILWLAPGEPWTPVELPSVVGEGASGRIELSGKPAYYFAVREVACKTACASRAGREFVPDDATMITMIKVRYFFYFEGETGEIAHKNDLESAEFWLLVEPDPEGQVNVFLWKVFGAAHGLSWSTNAANLARLSTVRDPRGWLEPFACPATAQGSCDYRPVLFVEAGKHATAPDVNRDGVLTPMIDLNKNQADAWGIRDALGTNSRVSSAFSPAMMVKRDPGNLWGPEGTVFRGGRAPTTPALKIIESSSTSTCLTGDLAGKYNDAYFDVVSKKQTGKVASLRGLARGKDFCKQTQWREDPDPKEADSSEAFQTWQPENPYKKILGGLNIAYRFDRGIGVAIVIPEGASARFLGGWGVLKLNLPVNKLRVSFGKDGLVPSLDAIFMSAATRKLGWYGGGGFEWNRSRPDFATSEPGLAWEIGFKVRAVETKGALWSGRIGYRFSGVSNIYDQRFVAEVGVGAW